MRRVSEEKFELRNLSSGQRYQVALSALNAVGQGEALKASVETSTENILSGETSTENILSGETSAENILSGETGTENILSGETGTENVLR